MRDFARKLVDIHEPPLTMGSSPSKTIAAKELKRLKIESKATKPADSQPPAYAEPKNPYSHLHIKATDVPQWLWTNAQCRAWLYSIFRDYLDYAHDKAENEALSFLGMGCNLYNNNAKNWRDLSGTVAG